MKDLVLLNYKPLTIESLKFCVLSYIKINRIEQGAKEFGVTLDPSKLKCTQPVNTSVTPDMEFKKTANSTWVLFEHCRFVCLFSEDFLQNMKTTLKV